MLEYKAKKLKQIKNQIEEEKEKLAREILVSTMQNIVLDYIDEVTVSRVKIDDETLKGKIIGKDGRNIRAFEAATGVEVIVDEAPDVIGISSFDPIRREVAVIALKELIKDGRVHPGTIEEFVKKARHKVENELKSAGRQLADAAGWYDIPAGLIPLLGRLKYRRSMGQSQFIHTLEVIKAGEYIARELGADENVVKKACLLHDIGKVLTHKIKKPHYQISADIARKYGLSEKIINAIEAHHGDVEAKSIEAAIVKIADAISGARPGARQESLDEYIERVKSLEKKAIEIGGNKVQDVYALSAGRELRVIVKPNSVSDDEAVVLARKIAKEIEESGVFPGDVEVVVIREMRAHAQAHRA